MGRKKAATPRLRAAAVILLAAAGVLAATPTPLSLPNLPPTYDAGTLIVAPTGSPPVVDGTVDAAWNSARVLEITAFGASGAWPAGAGINVRALHDDTTLYLLVQWDDATQDYSREAWQLADNRTAQGNWTHTTWGDDALAILFGDSSMGDPNFTAAGCGPMCHTSGVNEMRTDIGRLDAWVWSSSLTSPLGYADDQYLDNASKVTGSPTGGFHPDSGAEGWANNSIVTAFGPRPEFLNGTLPVTQSARVINQADQTAINWVTFNSSSMPNGTTVPGYVITSPLGGNSDVGAGSSYASSRWTVEMSRPFVTGDLATRDVDIADLNETYFFSLALFNNRTGINSSNSGFVHQMIFAANSLPDLTPESVTTQQPSTLIGDPVNLTVRVRNMGFGGSAGPVFVAVSDDLSALEVANGSAPAIASYDFYLLNLSFSSVGYAPGAHSFTASVDTANSENESFEDNNTRTFSVTFVAVVAPSDLEVTTADGPAGTVYGGDTFIVNGSVRNIGAGDSILNVTVEAGHPLFGNRTQDVGPLLSGQSANYSLTFDATGVPAGSWAISVKVDPTNLIPESREDNNQLIVVVAAENRSDLVASALSADPAAALAGATLNVTLTVTNRGVPFAGAIDVWIYLDDGISTSASNRTAVWNVSLGLLRGEKANFSANWTIPSALFVGNHTLRAFLDPLGAVEEISETNNNGTVQFIVLAPPKPDLVLLSAATLASSYRAGETATVTISVANQGTAYTGSVRLEIIEASVDRSMGNLTVAAVAPNTTVVLNFSFTVPGGSPGMHSIIAFVDADGVLDEERELNNAFSTTYALLAPAVPDLLIDGASPTPPLPTIGSQVTVTVVVSNGGTAVSSAGAYVTLTWGATSIGNITLPAIAPNTTFSAQFVWDTTGVGSQSPLLTATIGVPVGTPDDQANNVFTFTLDLLSPGQPQLHIGNIAVAPRTASAGDTVRVEALVFNNGSAAGSGVVVLIADGREVASLNFTLQPGANLTVRFNWTASGSGPVPVQVQLRVSSPSQTIGETATTVTITSAAPPGGAPWALVGLVVAVMIGLSGYVLFTRRKQDKGGGDSERQGSDPARSPKGRGEEE